ncbi:MAG: hypothetical protein KDA52_09280 [Planctomycetaceae bacterium]|nr:hypothetical protein [Planctomycetaceae bacterium]
MLKLHSQGRLTSVLRSLAVLLLLVTCMTACVQMSSPALTACPFCLGSQQLTLRERMDSPDASLIVEWKTGDPGNLDQGIPATTEFTILEVIKGDLKQNDSLTIDRYQEGQAGDQFLISGSLLDDVIKWDRAIPLSQVGLSYVKTLPKAEASADERLRHALKHLESPDDMVATDAFTVIAASKYEELSALREELPRKELRRWVFGNKPLKGQLGVYGMLLGICGDASDRQRLEDLALETTGELRLGIAGVMGGYLLLAGPEGLNVLDREFLLKDSCSSSDRYAVIDSLRFIWDYGDGCIDKERLRQSVRRQLDITEFPELSITDLARWEDWSVTTELLARYQSPPDKHIDTAIVNFMIVASQVDLDTVDQKHREALASAREFVERLQEEQPAVYKRAARLLISR